MEIRIRGNEGHESPVNLLIDTVWDVNRNRGVWVIDNQMLKCTNPLYTCILLCLFTDKRAIDGMEIPDGTDDKRGWFGDSVLLDGEFEIGSWLWILDRAVLNDETELKAHDYTLDALQPLLDQNVIGELKVNVLANKSDNKLELDIACYSHKDGDYMQQQFNIWWKNI